MIKKTLLTLYIIFSALTVYVFAMLIQAIAIHDSTFSINFLLFEITNPVLFLGIVMISIILGSINIILVSDSSKVSTFKISEEEATEKSGEKIADEIFNQYAARINEITDNVAWSTSGIKNHEEKVEKSLWSLCKNLELGQGLIYSKGIGTDHKTLQLIASYSFMGDLENIRKIEFGIGVSGQVAKTGEFIYLREVPKGYMKIVSGLGETSPDYLLIIPIKKTEEVVGIAELAGLGKLNKEEVMTIKELVQNTFSTLIIK